MLKKHIYVFIFLFLAYFYSICICVMLCFSASVQEKSKHTAHPFIPGKGCFVSRKKRNKTVLIHASGVDVMWRLSKLAIPCSLPTRVNSQVNPKLMRSISVWQWCWMNSKAKNLLEITGRSLQKGMAMWKEENTARVWQSKFPVNCRSWSKTQWKFPGGFSHLFWNRSIVSLWWRRHFFKTLTTAGAAFPPTGCLCICTIPICTSQSAT